MDSRAVHSAHALGQTERSSGEAMCRPWSSEENFWLRIMKTPEEHLRPCDWAFLDARLRRPRKEVRRQLARGRQETVEIRPIKSVHHPLQDGRGRRVLLDKRIAEKGYGKKLLKSLPPMLATRRVEDITRFLEEAAHARAR